MRILVTGASGFLGSALIEALGRKRHEVLRLTRGAEDPRDPRLLRWDPEGGWVDPRAFDGVDGVVHLAGESVAQRWTPALKQRIRDSRILGTRTLVDAMAKLGRRPDLFLCASAVGFYGDRGAEDLSENSASGTGFLAGVCREWEAEAARAEPLGVRRVSARLGVVLGRDGGALKRMALPFGLGLGGRLGDGRQWISWIALEDTVRALAHLLAAPAAQGAYNLTAPNPSTNAQFTQSLGRALNRPALLRVPGFALRLAMGEMAGDMLLGGQRALPLRLREAGFQWDSPYIGEALNKAYNA